MTIAAGLLLATIAGAAPDLASAGTYKVYQCSRQVKSPDPIYEARLTDSNPSTAELEYWMNNWQNHVRMMPAQVSTFGIPGADATNSCGTLTSFGSFSSAGYLTAIAHGYVGGSETGFEFRAPAGTTISSYKINRSVQLYPYTQYENQAGFPYYQLTRIAGTTSFAERCFVYEGCDTLGLSRSPNKSPIFAENVAGQGVTGIRVSAGCRIYWTGPGWTQKCGGYSGWSAELYVSSMEFNLEDSTPPTVSNISGNLPGLVAQDGGRLKGTKLVSFDSTDTASGVYRGVVEVDGQAVVRKVLDSNNGDCADAGVFADNDHEFDRAVPCKSSVNGEVEFDTTAVGDGLYSMRVYAEDAAGNRKTVIPTSEVIVDNVPDDQEVTGQGGAGSAPCNPCNGHGGDPRTARIVVNSSQRTLRAKYGKPMPITGRIVDAENRPVADADVDVLERVRLPGEELRKVRVLRTDGQGRYTHAPQTTSSRTVRIAFSATRGSTNYKDTADLDVVVASSVKLKARKQRVRSFGRMQLRGQILASPLRQGIVVEIQVRDGRRWRTISVKRTNTQGQLTFNYRFRTTVRARFQFRALVRQSSDLPVEVTASKPVRIKVG